MFLTLRQFLAYFPLIDMTKEEFVKKFKVTYSKEVSLEELFNLKSVIKTKDDIRYIQRDLIIDYFYDIIIVNRHKYLTNFYESYFQLPDLDGLKWDYADIRLSDGNFKEKMASCDFDTIINDFYDPNSKTTYDFISVQKNDASRRVIRNLNYLDILHTTKITNTCKANVSFWQTFLNAYNELRLEDRFFCKSSLGQFLKPKSKNDDSINYNVFFYLIQQYQPKASLLNSYSVSWILQNLITGDNKKLFTPVLSWSSYLLAFLNSNWTHYVGIDVIPTVCERAKFLIDVMDPKHKKTCDIYCKPSESFLMDDTFLNKYNEFFDVCMVCPPYYEMEIYDNNSGDQSTKLYKTYQDWLELYWYQTVVLCYLSIRRGGKLLMITNDYKTLKNEKYYLIRDMNQIISQYFKIENIVCLVNRMSKLRAAEKSRYETLTIWVRQ